MQEFHLLRIENDKEMTTYLLNTGVVTIGRALSNGITINDKFADWHHALLRRFPLSPHQHQYEILFGKEKGRIFHNGAWIDQEPCRGTTLVTGDRIQIGCTRLSYLVTSITRAECELYFSPHPTSSRKSRREDVTYICSASVA